MIYECAKCKDKIDGNIIAVQGSISYLVCSPCSEKFESLPTNLTVNFFNPNKETWVAKNMREAKERRVRGELLY